MFISNNALAWALAGAIGIGVFGFKPANEFANVVNRTLPEKRSIGLRLGFMGYRFGIGFSGMWVWDIDLGLGCLGYRFGIGLYGI